MVLLFNQTNLMGIAMPTNHSLANNHLEFPAIQLLCNQLLQHPGNKIEQLK